MTILLVRHGETTDNASQTFQMPGSSLSKTGNEQAVQLAERLAHANISDIICSDYLRTKETAGYIIGRTNIEANYLELLRERNFGELRGRPYAELGFDPFALDYQPDNGESWSSFNARISLAWDHIVTLAAQATGDILVVTHGFVCYSIIANHTRLLANQEPPTRWGNTSLTEIEPVSPWSVITLNCTEHLRGPTQWVGQA
jgi:broad specificity phosphatase PhoE